MAIHVSQIWPRLIAMFGINVEPPWEMIGIKFKKISFELCFFLFGTQTLIYQMKTNGEVGGALGRNASLKFQYFF